MRGYFIFANGLFLIQEFTKPDWGQCTNFSFRAAQKSTRINRAKKAGAEKLMGEK